MNNVIKALRGERGISQQVLADVLGVSRQTINSIESGRYDPSLPLAFRLSRYFQLPIEQLFNDESGDA